jgi:hypothetical protein
LGAKGFDVQALQERCQVLIEVILDRGQQLDPERQHPT